MSSRWEAVNYDKHNANIGFDEEYNVRDHLNRHEVLERAPVYRHLFIQAGCMGNRHEGCRQDWQHDIWDDRLTPLVKEKE
jgi:hypothetical protein